MGRRLALLVPVALFLAVAGILVVGLERDPQVIPSALLDKPAPAFDLPPLLDGRPGLRDTDLKGRVSLVNVFASWCGPCRAEHPLLMQLAAERSLSVYGINYKDAPEKARAWLRQLGDPYASIGRDQDGRASIDWGVYGIPETFLVDREGRIRFKHVGPLTPKVVESQLRPLIQVFGG